MSSRMTNLHHLHPTTPLSRAENLVKATSEELTVTLACEMFLEGLRERDPVKVATAARAFNSAGAWLMEAAREAGV